MTKDFKEFGKNKKRALSLSLLLIGCGIFMMTFLVENDAPLNSVFMNIDVTNGWVKDPRSSLTSHHKVHIDQNKTASVPEDTKLSEVDTQSRRLKIIANICSNKTSRTTVVRTNSHRQYFTPKYNFSFCKVPKIGSTFWTQVFQVLESDSDKYDIIFNRKRAAVHGTSNQLPKKSNDSNVPVVIPTRNPYSRLYSAFVDKSYLRLFSTLNNEVRRLVPNKLNTSDPCLNNITFKEFLEFIVLSARHRHPFNEHWAPVYSICTPCDKNISFVVKQETFTTNVNEVLKYFNVDEEKINVLKTVLEDHRVENSLPGIIRTVYLRTQHIRKCFSAELMLKRVWESFQIQGYVSNEIPFPAQNFTKKSFYDDTEFSVKVLMETIMRSPMTSEESRSQRQQALAHAYRDINDKIINDIKKVYANDFKTFDYDETKPS